jgi:hypothetical protein
MKRIARILFIGILCCAGFLTGISAASGIQTAMGDTVTLSGYSYGGPNAYLFLTGPNLPANGVALNNINRLAEQGGFTVVSVDGNNHWTYKWNTANIGGRLDAGSYTIWVVNGPNDRSRLNEAEYSTIQVTLGVPSISVDTPAVPATLDVTTEPSGAIIRLNEKYLGRTPLTSSGLDPGTYTLSISKTGYQNITTPVRLDGGRITEVNAPLVPEEAAPTATIPESPPIPDTVGTGQGSAVISVSPSATTPKAAGFAAAVPVYALGIAGIAGLWLRKRLP